MTPEVQQELEAMRKLALLNLQASSNNLEAIARHDKQITEDRKRLDQAIARQEKQMVEERRRADQKMDEFSQRFDESIAELKELRTDHTALQAIVESNARAIQALSDQRRSE